MNWQVDPNISNHLKYIHVSPNWNLPFLINLQSIPGREKSMFPVYTSTHDLYMYWNVCHLIQMVNKGIMKYMTWCKHKSKHWRIFAYQEAFQYYKINRFALSYINSVEKLLWYKWFRYIKDALHLFVVCRIHLYIKQITCVYCFISRKHLQMYKYLQWCVHVPCMYHICMIKIIGIDACCWELCPIFC